MKTVFLDPILVQDRSDSNIGPWLLGLSVAALVGLVILFIYRKRKQKSS